MNEANDLNNCLTTYKTQLEQIELAILNSNDATDDLLKLKYDLQQLIDLTQESLIKAVHDEKPSKNSSGLDDEFNKFYSEINSDLYESSDLEGTSNANISIDKDSSLNALNQLKANNDDHEGDSLIGGEQCNLNDDDSDVISGTKCRLQYGHEWGEMTQHNAVILSCEEIEGELMARVLFCNPTHNSMKPCTYYLEDNCKFDDHECKFSHGHLVAIDDLTQYKDPDYKLLSIGSFCLAKDSDDLWYKATVVNVLEDGNIQISFNENGNLETLELQNILPLASNSDEMNSENDDLYSISSTSNDEANDDDVNIYDESSLMPESTFNIKTINLLGGWEQYTKGIGSKLMAKMGYVTGQGLGRNSDGRAEPVPIQLLPQGKSLDKIMEFRERSKDGTFDIFKKGRRKFKIDNSKLDFQRHSVFDFMNAKFNDKSKERTTRINKKPNSIVSITTQDLKNRTDKHINIQLLKTADEITKIGIEINKLNTGLERNLEKNDVIAANKIRQKISELESYRNRLRTSEKFMNQQKISRKARKELVVF